MGMRSSSGSPARWLAGLALIAAAWWVAFEQQDRIPVLTYVNLGLHEAGHMLTYSWSEVTTAMMGSIVQVAVPVLLALYFFFRRGDWVGAGVCLVWAATSAMEVAIYVADAPKQELELIGDQHDWAFILGPEGYDAMSNAGSLADTIRTWAAFGLIAGAVLCLAAPLRGVNRKAQDDSAAATSRPTPASSA